MWTIVASDFPATCENGALGEPDPEPLTAVSSAAPSTPVATGSAPSSAAASGTAKHHARARVRARDERLHQEREPLRALQQAVLVAAEPRDDRLVDDRAAVDVDHRRPLEHQAVAVERAPQPLGRRSGGPTRALVAGASASRIANSHPDVRATRSVARSRSRSAPRTIRRS
jgi:hypothetical protein